MTSAERLVRERLRGGSLGFDEFMEIALYDPDVGFYATRGRAGGRAGDFITSPETGPLFGVLVGRLLDRVWHDLGEPDHFTFVDAGAGPGTLARTVLAAEPDCRDALRIVCVEVSAAQRALHPTGVESRATLPDEPVIGVIFANELLDNLPFRIAEFGDGGWVEAGVGSTAAGLGFVAAPLDDASGRRCRSASASPVAGMRIPLADRAAAWVDEVRSQLAQGQLVVVDYGAPTAELATRVAPPWLRTHRGHESDTDPFDAVGQRDITADVPFDQLPTPDRQLAQADWLRDLGIDDLVDEGRRIWSERAGIGDLDALKARSRVGEAEALVDPSGLGGFVVLEWDAGTERR